MLYGGSIMPEKRMNLIDHLDELRNRIIICLVSIIILAGFSYIFVEDIINYISQPVGNELIFLAPTEAFFTQIKVSLFCGFFLSLPVILFQIWKFIYPALKKEEKKYINILLPLSFIFFIGGGAFALLVIIPFGVNFFINISINNLQPRFSLSNYISFILGVILPFALVFQLPLVITILTKLKLISSGILIRNRTYILVFIFIFAAILTPPDIISQIMMALPLILLYEGSILLAKVLE